MSEEPVRPSGQRAPRASIALFAGIAIGFVLGAFVGPTLLRSTDDNARSAPQQSPGATPFSGPIGAEGGGFDGEPV